MKPLLKWPGGKSREISQVLDLIPDFDRYLEPFFGGGAMFFHLQPKEAAINDASRDLMEFYHMIRTGNEEFREALEGYALSFRSLLELCRGRVTELLALLELLEQDKASAREQTYLLVENWLPEILALFPCKLVVSEEDFCKVLQESVWDKLQRTAENQKKQPFPPEDLAENLVTGFSSGYYLYFRDVYNHWQLGRCTLSAGQRMANFFFIREFCYGSMFRYNKAGEFNIPYGGISYNHKDFTAKVQTLFQEETADLFTNTQIYCRDFETFFETVKPRKGDFIFLDPPYDTEFSDYDGLAFTKLDQARLAVALSKTPAKFLLIIKNTPYIEALYSDGFYVRRFDKQYAYNVRSRNDRQAEHLIVTNYPIEPDI